MGGRGGGLVWVGMCGGGLILGGCGVVVCRAVGARCYVVRALLLCGSVLPVTTIVRRWLYPFGTGLCGGTFVSYQLYNVVVILCVIVIVLDQHSGLSDGDH